MPPPESLLLEKPLIVGLESGEERQEDREQVQEGSDEIRGAQS